MLNTNAMEIENKLNAWLADNDPILVTNNIQNRAHISAPIIASTPEQSTNIAASTAVVLGDCNYKEVDSEIKSKMNSNKAEALKAFTASPLSGCTTVLDMARISSGYDPNSDMSGDNKENYKKYLKKIVDCPFFHLRLNICDTYNRNEKSWNDAITQIADLFTGVADKDKDKIIQSIKNLANVVASNRNTRQGTSIFSVSALNTDKNTVEAYIYHSDISMRESKSKGSDCKETSLNIFKIYLDFRNDIWPEYAEKVFEKHYKAVDDWLDDNTTKQGNIESNLCIGGYKKI